jgi:HlyD family secretion protein
VADAEQAVADAQSGLDAMATAWRAGTDSVDQTKLDQAKAALAQARDRLMHQQSALERLQADATMPLPTATEGQYTIARQELEEARALLAQSIVRAPADLTVLQVDAKPGEMATPAASAPLMLLGDVATLRVRVALDEQDLAGIKPGQPAVVRNEAFRDREFAGTVSFIAPIVEPGRVKSRANSNETSEAGVADVLVDLDRPEALIVGMKVDVFFPLPAPERMQPTEHAGSALRSLFSDICPRCAVAR